MSIPIVRTSTFNFQGLKLEIDRTSTETRANRVLRTPFMESTDPPRGVETAQGGGLSYDVITDRPYYSDGFNWFPMGSGAPGTVMSYSQIKDGDQIIPRVIPTTLAPWDVISNLTYHTIPGWDLVTGVYTADQQSIITVNVNISWAGGVSNLGNRILRIVHFDIGTATTTVVKEAVTQADPNLLVDTTQEASIHLAIQTGDQVYVEVEHDAPLALTICGGDCTSLSGFRVQTT